MSLGPGRGEAGVRKGPMAEVRLRRGVRGRDRGEGRKQKRTRGINKEELEHHRLQPSLVSCGWLGPAYIVAPAVVLVDVDHLEQSANCAECAVTVSQDGREFCAWRYSAVFLLIIDCYCESSESSDNCSADY